MLRQAATRLLAVSIIVAMGIVAVVSPVFAQDFGPYSASQARVDKAQYDAAIQNCETPSLECLVHQIYKFTMIESVNSIAYREALQSSDAGNGTQVASGGFTNDLFGLISVMYGQPPARTHVWVADVMQEMNIATPAYAQGLGFAALDPVLDLWKMFRNVAYVFFVVIFIVIGFMIMFRQKIGGQGAVTAQQAIPSVIISLILVTFSYAIAGFMIDLMYVIMFLIIGIFSNTFSAQKDIINFNIIELMGELFTGSSATNFSSNINIITTMLASLAANEQLAQIGGLIGGITLTFVIAIAILIGTFKLFFELLKSYASIVLDVIIGPIYLMFGAIPGRNTFMPWFRDLAGNLAAFPTVLFVTVLFYEFSENSSFQGTATSYGGFMPPFLLGRGQQGAIASLMGLAIILAMPEIVKEVKTAVGAKDGIGTKIAGWAQARASKGLDWAEKGIPTVTGTALGTAAGVQTYRRARNAGWSRGEALRYGLAGVVDKDGKREGGFLSGFSRGADAGLSIRRGIDRAKRGALFDAEDPTKYLRDIYEKNNKPRKLKVPEFEDRNPGEA